MPKAMNAADWRARAQAYIECAEHLDMSWTDDPKEREQGNIVIGKLKAEAAKCDNIAAQSD